MNFKALALGSVLAISTVFGGMVPAEARPSTCWEGSRSVVPARGCDVEMVSTKDVVFWRINYGQKNVVLYDDGTAQIFWGTEADDNGGYNWYTWEYDSDGDVRVYGTDGYMFAFRR